MSKSEKIAELNRLVIPFFETDDVSKANAIREKIITDVYSFDYPVENSRLIEMSMQVWKQDLSNYLNSLSSGTPDKMLMRQAHLALKGIINLIEYSTND